MTRRFSASRIFATLASCALALGLVLSLAGCGGSKTSEEDLIREAVAQVMDIFKNPTEENLGEFVDATDIDELAQYGVDAYEFLGHAFTHFEYVINGVTVDGDTAQVDLTLTNADLNEAMEKATAVLTEDPEQYADLLTQEDGYTQLMQILFQEFYAQLDASETLVSSDATLVLHKNDGTWEVDEESMMNVASAMYGGVEI